MPLISSDAIRDGKNNSVVIDNEIKKILEGITQLMAIIGISENGNKRKVSEQGGGVDLDALQPHINLCIKDIATLLAKIEDSHEGIRDSLEKTVSLLITLERDLKVGEHLLIRECEFLEKLRNSCNNN